MARHRTRGTSTIAGDRLDPGLTKTHKIFGPARGSLVQAGVYRPANRWRQTPQHGDHATVQPGSRDRNILQRPLLLAKQLPWLHKYNYARS